MGALSAQVLMSDQNLDGYPFIRDKANVFSNSEKGLEYFYGQLAQLESGQRRTVNIVHIGDSHLQADFFSGTFRKLMHQRFGAAGRGLVFPFTLAKTNSPVDIKAMSNTRWDVQKTVTAGHGLPIGVSGITLRTQDPHFVLQLSLGKNAQNLDYTFNKVTLFNEKGKECFDFLLSDSQDPRVFEPVQTYERVHHEVQVGETLGGIAERYGLGVSDLRALNNMQGDLIYAGQKLVVQENATGNAARSQVKFRDLASVDNSYQGRSEYSTTVFLDQPITSVLLRGNQTSSQQNRATLYGIVLENDMKSGILYHMIGVNGAMFRHYNAAPNFFPQVRELQPDLIIISLGTNDSSGKYFNEQWFYDHVNRMVSLLKHHAPHADILLMTPSDAYRYRKYQNPNPGKAKELLLQYALEHNMAAWNFYEVMGGYGAIDQWYEHGLAQRDRLHLTRKGYELQGKLMFEALMRGYESYLSDRPK